MDDDEDSYKIPTPIPSIGCQALLEQHCSHCGWLRKRRHINFWNWPQAYVVLREGCLYYFKHEKAKSASGKFSLYGYNTVTRAKEISVKEAPWCFKVIHSHQEFKTYYFSASSEQEMKIWMGKMKIEMISANGKSAIYGKCLSIPTKEDKQDIIPNKEDAGFYQDVETNIYDDSSKFIPTTDYQKKCSIKKVNEESDDEDLLLAANPLMDARPPAPIPQDRDPFCSYLKPSSLPPANLKPARLLEPPPTPPRSRQKPSTPEPQSKETSGNRNNFLQELNMKMEEAGPIAKSKLRRKPSYEKTDCPLPSPGTPDPSSVHVDFRKAVQSHSGGGSTGEDDFEHRDTEEYWNSVHFDSNDKQRAHDILQEIAEEGVYLVRPENKGDGKVLVVYAGDQTKKYRIRKSPDHKYYLAEGGYRDKVLENLLYYYYEQDLPTVNVKLKQPYQLHPKYKKLNM